MWSQQKRSSASSSFLPRAGIGPAESGSHRALFVVMKLKSAVSGNSSSAERSHCVAFHDSKKSSSRVAVPLVAFILWSCQGLGFGFEGVQVAER